MKIFSLHFFFLFLIFLAAGTIVTAQTPAPPKNRILFILDASGSMYDIMEGRTRIVIAKEILSKLVDSLKSKENLELALRVFGHQFDKKYNNCNDTKLEVPFRPGNHDEIIKKIKGLDPKGTTLIANSLLQAAEDFPKENTRNIIILITDGIEACGGDPCALSVALQKKNIFLKPFVIGLGSDANFAKAFGCMGQYFDANDSKSFQKVLEKVMTQALGKTSVRINLLDSNDKPLETNVNVSLANSVTGQTVYDFVHYLKPDGKSDEIEIDPVLSYDVIVNTIPQVVKKGVYIEGGKENIITVKTPQGSLYFKSNYNEYKSLPLLIKKAGTAEIINVQQKNTFEKYLVGYYDIEILTLPRTILRNVKIEQSRTTTIDIDAPGVLNVLDNVGGFGSIYQIKSNGEQEWICNLENENSKATLGMQPGEYKLVFRSKKATGSRFTDVRNFTIRSGTTTNIRLYKY